MIVFKYFTIIYYRKMVNKKELINCFTKSLVVEEQRKNRVTTNGITSTLIVSALSMAFVNESCKSAGQVSKSQVIYRKLEAKSLDDVQNCFREHTVRFVKFLKIFSRNRKFVISFDTTDEAFYGEYSEAEDKLYLHEGSEAREAEYHYKFLTVAITTSFGSRYVLDGVILPRGHYIEDYVGSMLKFVKKHLPLETVLFDRGFTSWAVIHVLRKLKVCYMIFWKKHGSWYKKHFNQMKKEECKRILRKYKYCKDKNGYKVKSHFILIKQLKYEEKTYDWIFATNLKLDKAENYVKIYKKRWGIETIYRVTDDIRAYTTSTKALLRYFLFMFTCLTYNLWKHFQNYLGENFALTNFQTCMIIFLTKTGNIYPVHYDQFEQIMQNQHAPI